MYRRLLRAKAHELSCPSRLSESFIRVMSSAEEDREEHLWRTLNARVILSESFIRVSLSESLTRALSSAAAPDAPPPPPCLCARQLRQGRPRQSSLSESPYPSHPVNLSESPYPVNLSESPNPSHLRRQSRILPQERQVSRCVCVRVHK